jgi:hypothetical protein
MDTSVSAKHSPINVLKTRSKTLSTSVDEAQPPSSCETVKCMIAMVISVWFTKCLFIAFQQEEIQKEIPN